MPSVAAAIEPPPHTASASRPHGSQWPGAVSAMTKSRIEPATLLRSVSPSGVSLNCFGLVTATMSSVAPARSRRWSASGLALQWRASSSSEAVPPAIASATPSCAIALMICACHIPMSICSMTACGGLGAVSCISVLSSDPSAVEDVAGYTRKGLGRIVADAVLLRRHDIAEHRAPVTGDGHLGRTALAAEAHALVAGVEVDDDVRAVDDAQSLVAQKLPELAHEDGVAAGADQRDLLAVAQLHARDVDRRLVRHLRAAFGVGRK